MDHMSPLDSMFLHVEDGITHMHIGSCSVFEGPAPGYDEIVALDREQAAADPPLPAEGALRAGRAGPPGVGRRPALQPRVPRPPHRAATARVAKRISTP